MIRNQRKMMTSTTRNSQWSQQPQQSKTKEYQSKGKFFQRTLKFHSTAIKTKKMKELEKIMVFDEEALLRFKVGSNPLIVKNIMAHMNFSTLINARLASKEWKKLANLELGRSKCARKCWRFGRKWGSQLRRIRNSDTISWTEFDMKNLDVESRKKFATFCGPQVKMLKLPRLETLKDIPAPERVWDFLSTGKFPNLEVLRFDPQSTFNFWKSEPLKWTSNADTILPNLRRIEDISIWEYSLLPSTFLQDKGHLVKSATLESWDYDHHRDHQRHVALNLTTLLAHAKPELERLVIRKDGGSDLILEFFQQIVPILESSRKSLRVLEIALYSDVPFNYYNHFWRFRHHFQPLDLNASIAQTCVSLFYQLERFYPDTLLNLTTVKIEVSTWTELNFPGYLSRFSPTKGGILTSVVNLELKYKYPHRDDLICHLLQSEWFPWLSTCFPNIQNLTTERCKDTDQVLRHVFTLWPKLTSLSLTCFDFDGSCASLDLDPVLTGFSAEKCEELIKSPEKLNIKLTKEILMERTWPNLNSLKELTRLDFILTASGSRRPFWCPVSLVSFLYAINLSSELKTTIRFDQKANGYRKILRPLAPYARLEDLHGNDCKF